MLLCDNPKCAGGDATGWHLRCLDPPLSHVPTGKWYCPMCAQCAPPSRQATPSPTAEMKVEVDLEVGAEAGADGEAKAETGRAVQGRFREGSGKEAETGRAVQRDASTSAAEIEISSTEIKISSTEIELPAGHEYFTAEDLERFKDKASLRSLTLSPAQPGSEVR